jgi:predicted TPR repeat methyltransferase
MHPEPEFAEAHASLGDVLLEHGEFEQAVASYEEALALKPGLFATRLNLASARINLSTLLARQGRLEAALDGLRKVLALHPDNSDAYGNIGAMLLDQGRFDEVIAVGRRALSIRPDSARAHEVMGRAYHHKGDLEEAANCYRGAVELGTTNASIPHFLAAVTGENVGPVPKAAVVSLFERYAPRFDAHLIGELGYTTPMLMRDAIGRLTHDRRFQHALDLGCGTGLVGASFRDIVGEIIGVDLSARMLEQAGRRAMYANLHLDEIVDWLEHAAANRRIFDIVLSADVFIYVGNLDPVFEGVRAVLAGGGLFVFSVEYLAQGSCKLLPTGRFGHSVAYIRKLASTHGLQIELVEPIDLRRDLGEMIPGTIFVLQRPEPS